MKPPYRLRSAVMDRRPVSRVAVTCTIAVIAALPLLHSSTFGADTASSDDSIDLTDLSKVPATPVAGNWANSQVADNVPERPEALADSKLLRSRRLADTATSILQFNVHPRGSYTLRAAVARVGRECVVLMGPAGGKGTFTFMVGGWRNRVTAFSMTEDSFDRNATTVRSGLPSGKFVTIEVVVNPYDKEGQNWAKLTGTVRDGKKTNSIDLLRRTRNRISTSPGQSMALTGPPGSWDRCV